MSVTDQVIRLAQGWEGDGPVELIRLCLFDWAAVAMAGQDEPVAQALAMQAGVEGDASVLGGGQTSAADAALINGTTGHALDYDDTHFDHIGHTSAVVMPAVLALAEDQMMPAMNRVLDAALIGSEAAVRFGLWLGRDHYQVGFHQTATSGAIGAAVAGARFLRMDAAQTRHAIGLAATGASGLKGQFGTMGKPLNAGLAARCGVESVLWAQAGLTSDPDALAQFGVTHHGVGDDSAWDVSEPWKVARVSHKFHACCHGLHAMLEALRGVEGDLAAVTVHTHPRWMSVCNKPAPQTGLETKFSYRMAAALALSGRDTSDIMQFSDAAADDPALHVLRDAVTVVADDNLTETQARVEVAFADGRTDARTHDLAKPLTHEVRETRLRNKARALLGREAAALWEACHAADIDDLTALMRG